MKEKGQIRIVVVDDYATVREVVRLLLEEEGFTVVAEAEDEVAALKAVERTNPHAVLLDYMLRSGESLEFISELKRKKPDLAVVVTSGYPPTKYAARAITAGASGVYVKGGRASELGRIIRDAINASASA